MTLVVLLAGALYSLGSGCGRVGSKPGSSDSWDVFFERRDRQTYERLRSAILSCSEREIWRPDSAAVPKLVRGVEEGSELAAGLAIAAADLLDGGELEDLLRAVGNFAERYPERFLRFVREQPVGVRRLEAFLVVLPEDSVDRPNEQVRIVEERIRALSEVRDEDLTLERDVSVLILRRFLQRLQMS
jgi:hypothetical protein